MRTGRGVLLMATLAAALIMACGGGENEKGKEVTLGSLPVSEHGTKDASSATSLKLEADDFYFDPTFIRGKAGQTLKLTIENDSKSLHNFSVGALQIDKDVAAKGKVEVEVTFPQSGVLLFLCKYHTGQGMNGELLTGDAQPQAPPAAASTVKIADSALGKILTDGAGLTLYTFKNDVPGSGKSAVSGQLAVTWPPLILTGSNPVKPDGLGGDLALITRDDGAKQVAYKGQPLYRFARDTSPGDTNGQGVGGVWFVATP